MSIAHLLVDFGQYHKGETENFFSDATLEEHQLEAFEQGYQAGWDDSAKAHAEESNRVSAELAATIQDWAFTFKDAQTQILKTLTPLFQEISETLVPALGKSGAPHVLAGELKALAQEELGEGLSLYVAKSEHEQFIQQLDRIGRFGAEIFCDQSLHPGEFRISAGENERFVDMNQVIRTVQETLESFTHSLERTGTNAK